MRCVHILSALALLAVAACESPQRKTVSHAPGVTYGRVTFEDLEGWDDNDPRGALQAFRRSCAKLTATSEDKRIGSGPVARPASSWKSTCGKAETLPDDTETARLFFESQFTPYAIRVDGNPIGKMTGYFEPQLYGSRTRTGRFRYPLYRSPGDLVVKSSGSGKGGRGRMRHGRLVPYYSRSDIEAGALAGRGLELAWVDDPVALFFLHIQGSGQVVLPDGDIMRVGYAQKNGHKYVAIGGVLVNHGELEKEELSMQSIAAWLRDNPREGERVMAANPSYIFFREVTGEGPIGAQGVALTPERSLAVDRRYIPLGAPVWLDTTWPRPDDRPLRRMMVAQDVGGAIKGAIRADIFWGAGPEAGERAGTMNRPGRLFVLVPD